MADHDQRLKSAIRGDLPSLPALAAPEWAAAVEGVEEWLEQELFPDPPAGERRLIDLLARVRLRAGGLALAHVEVESADNLTSLRERMLRYRPHLRNKHGFQVLSAGVYMQVGLDGTGRDEARDEFAGDLLDLTRWRYLGLPALDGTDYATGDNLLGVALVGLMRVPVADRPRVKADAMRRLAEADLPTLRRYLLMEMIEAYIPLDGPLIQQYQDLLVKEEYSAVIRIGETTFERGEKTGRRAVVREMLEAKFGALPDAAARRLEEWPIERVNAAARALLAADATLGSLGLVDPA